VQNEEKRIGRDEEEKKNLNIGKRQEALYGTLVTAAASATLPKEITHNPSQIGSWH
jgi:hypothetical protein